MMLLSVTSKYHTPCTYVLRGGGKELGCCSFCVTLLKGAVNVEGCYMSGNLSLVEAKDGALSEASAGFGKWCVLGLTLCATGQRQARLYCDEAGQHTVHVVDTVPQSPCRRLARYNCKRLDAPALNTDPDNRNPSNRRA